MERVCLKEKNPENNYTEEKKNRANLQTDKVLCKIFILTADFVFKRFAVVLLSVKFTKPPDLTNYLRSMAPSEVGYPYKSSRVILKFSLATKLIQFSEKCTMD